MFPSTRPPDLIKKVDDTQLTTNFQEAHHFHNNNNDNNNEYLSQKKYHHVPTLFPEPIRRQRSDMIHNLESRQDSIQAMENNSNKMIQSEARNQSFKEQMLSPNKRVSFSTHDHVRELYMENSEWNLKYNDEKYIEIASIIFDAIQGEEKQNTTMLDKHHHNQKETRMDSFWNLLDHICCSYNNNDNYDDYLVDVDQDIQLTDELLESFQIAFQYRSLNLNREDDKKETTTRAISITRKLQSFVQQYGWPKLHELVTKHTSDQNVVNNSQQQQQQQQQQQYINTTTSKITNHYEQRSNEPSDRENEINTNKSTDTMLHIDRDCIDKRTKGISASSGVAIYTPHYNSHTAIKQTIKSNTGSGNKVHQPPVVNHHFNPISNIQADEKVTYANQELNNDTLIEKEAQTAHMLQHTADETAKFIYNAPDCELHNNTHSLPDHKAKRQKCYVNEKPLECRNEHQINDHSNGLVLEPICYEFPAKEEELFHIDVTSPTNSDISAKELINLTDSVNQLTTMIQCTMDQETKKKCIDLLATYESRLESFLEGEQVDADVDDNINNEKLNVADMMSSCKNRSKIMNEINSIKELQKTSRNDEIKKNCETRLKKLKSMLRQETESLFEREKSII